MPARTRTLTGRRAVITLIAAAGVVLTSAPAFAAPDAPAPAEASQPATAAEAALLVAQKGHDLEVVTEEFNTAREVLKADQAAAAQALAGAAAAQAALDTARSQVTGVARSAYTSNQHGSLEAMLTSTSAGEFIDRIATLDMLAGHNVEVLGAAAQADEAATAAQAAAEQTAADAQAQLESVSAQQAALQSQITSYQAEYQRLSAEEQAAALAAAAAAHATEAAAASAAASSAPAPSASSSSSASSSRTGSSSASSAAAPAPAAPAGSAVTANSGAAQTAVDTAMAQRGDPYVWAAAGPNSYDCSGLMQYAYAAAGISLPHSSSMQARMGRAVTRAELQPGDLIAFYSPVSHIGMYIGNGMMVHAPTSGDVVKTVAIDYMGQITAMRRLAG